MTSYFTDILKRFKTMMQIFIEVCSINEICRKLKIAKCENEFESAGQIRWSILSYFQINVIFRRPFDERMLNIYSVNHIK